MKSLDSLKEIYLKAKEDYYNSVSKLTDAQFDKLEDQIRKLDPKWIELRKTGVKISNKKTEVKLLQFAPSLNKMYDKDIAKFYNRFKVPVLEWVWMDKLDGTSLQLAYKDGKPLSLVTRGDGEYGGDISFFIPHLIKNKTIPKSISAKELTVFRIEGIMRCSTFNKVWSREALGDNGADNIRNMVNGIFNRKEMHPALKDVKLIVLGVYGVPLLDGLLQAELWGFEVVPCLSLKGAKSVEEHSAFLKKRKKHSHYEMDGIVIAPSHFIMDYKNSDKPKQIIAYKYNDELNAVKVTVQKVIYQTSGFGRIIPKVEIDPTPMDGVIVKYCTVHNAEWMIERSIGPGAVIKVVRSGGVIPKIVDVVKKGKVVYPDVAYEMKGVHFYASDESEEQDVRKIIRFLSTLGIEFIAAKTIKSLYQSSVKNDFALKTAINYIQFINSSKFTDSSRLQYLQQSGLGPVQSRKILDELNRVLKTKLSLKLLMVASSCFDPGVGNRRLSAIEVAGISMDDLLNFGKVSLQEKLLTINGFAEANVNLIVNGVSVFKVWFKQVKNLLNIDGSLPIKKLISKGKLQGLNISWTGYRSKDEELFVKENGGEITPFSNKTTILLYRNTGKESSKVQKAGNRAITWEQFTNRFCK